MVDIDESGNEQDATVRSRRSCIDCGEPLHPRRRKRCGPCQEAHIRDMAREYQRKKQGEMKLRFITPAEHRQEPIVIEMEDDIVHSDERPRCSDNSCPCHEEGQ